MRRSLLRLTLAVAAAASCCGTSAAATVPGASWVYPYFDELRLREAGPAFFVLTGPYQRSAVATWLAAAGPDALGATARSRWLESMLRRELDPELSRLGEGSLAVTFEAALSSCVETDRKARPQAVMTFAAAGAEGLDLWGRLRASVNGAGEHKTEARPWRQDARASFDQGGVGYTRGTVSLFVGRDEACWGLAPLGGLLLSGSSPSMDMVRLSVRAGGFSLTSFHSQLRRVASDPWGAGVRRYAAGHRLEVAPAKGLNFSVSEVVLYGGEGRSVEIGYLNPLAPLYAEQWNSESEDNILAACDCALLVPKRAEVRLEVVVDDFQIDKDSEPSEVAAGVEVRAVNPVLSEASLLGLSYRLATNRTYGHRVAWNRFTHEGAVMGYPGGPDGDNLEAWASLAAGDSYLVTVGYGLLRRGQGRVDDPQDEPGKRLRFPSGVVEKTHSLAAEVVWRPSHPLLAMAKAEWSWTADAGNVEGEDDRGFAVSLRVEYALRATRTIAIGDTDE